MLVNRDAGNSEEGDVVLESGAVPLTVDDTGSSVKSDLSLFLNAWVVSTGNYLDLCSTENSLEVNKVLQIRFKQFCLRVNTMSCSQYPTVTDDGSTAET